MWSERVKSAVQESFPGAMVGIEIEGHHLTVHVVGTGHDRKQATSMLHGALNKIGALANFYAVEMDIHRSREDWIPLELRRRIYSAINQIPNGPDVHVEVDVRVFGTTLEISVCPPLNGQVQKQLDPILNELMNLCGATRITVKTYDGMHSYPIQALSVDDDDDDDNPNWPSKTGNPSGGGRGNNPPGNK